MTCEVCGAIVGDVETHEWWHAEGHPIWTRERVEDHRFRVLAAQLEKDQT